MTEFNYKDKLIGLEVQDKNSEVKFFGFKTLLHHFLCLTLGMFLGHFYLFKRKGGLGRWLRG